MIVIDKANDKDYQAVYRLAGNIDGIEQHAEHVYKIMADHFGDSFFIAREKKNDGSSVIMGFMLGFRSQKIKGHFFWQIAVSSESQGKSAGSALLAYTLEYARKLKNIQAVIATVETTNIGSQRLFEKLAFEVSSEKFLNTGQTLTVESG